MRRFRYLALTVIVAWTVSCGSKTDQSADCDAAGSLTAASGVESENPLLPFDSPYFLFVYSAGPNWKVGSGILDQDLADHFVYMSKLESTGELVHGGPIEHGDGSYVVGVLDASSRERAEALIDADPAITSGVQQVVLLSRWIPAAGSGDCITKELVTPNQ